MTPTKPIPAGHDQDDEEQPADAILAAAQQRALGGSPRLRRLSAVLWSSFLGAAASLLVLLLAPEDWTHLSLDLGRLTLVFFAQWVLMMIPAFVVCTLTSPTPRKPHARR